METQKSQILLAVNVFATDLTDAKRQAAILAQDYAVVELLDVQCTSYPWEQVTDHYPKLWMFRIIFAIERL